MQLTENHVKAYTLKPHENMTIYNAVTLKEQLISCLENNNGIVLDLSSISEMDTAGLQVLILAQQHALQSGKLFQLADCSSIVQEIFELCNLNTLFSNANIVRG